MTNVAIREARRRSRSPVPTSAPGFCKREVRECYRILVSRSGSAAEAWHNARIRHPETDPGSIPRGVPVYWTGGSEGFGHIAITTGDGGMWSTDIIRSGFFDRTGIRKVSLKWGLRLVGWSEDLDGVRVWKDGKAVGPAHVERAFALTAAEAELVAAGGHPDPVVPDDEASQGWTFDEETGLWVQTGAES